MILKSVSLLLVQVYLIQPNSTIIAVTTMLKIASNADENLYSELKPLWELDHIGIKEPTDNVVAVDKFQQSISYEKCRYSACLPCKDEHPDLPINRFLAIKRLKSLLNNLSKNPKMSKLYNNIIKEQLLSEGFIEEIDDNLAVPAEAIVHYMPHHTLLKMIQ